MAFDFKGCCCCCSLETGVLFIAIFELILGSMGLIYFVFSDYGFDNAGNILLVSAYISLPFVITTAGLLIFGVQNKRTAYIKVWIVFKLVLLPLLGFNAIVSFLIGYYISPLLFMAILIVILIVLYSYLILVVRSYYNVLTTSSVAVDDLEKRRSECTIPINQLQ
ncbi:hypothetical protein ACFFRR_000259 [Megaselia abdita]